MHLPIYQWLTEDEYPQWVCPHMHALLEELKKHGNGIKTAGLVNYRSPEAVLFLRSPLLEVAVKEFLAAEPALRLEHNGIGQLHSVQCSEHYVSIQFSEVPA